MRWPRIELRSLIPRFFFISQEKEIGALDAAWLNTETFTVTNGQQAEPWPTILLQAGELAIPPACQS